MAIPLHLGCFYEEIDSDLLPASRRFATWRETRHLPMLADPMDEDGRRRFRIRLRRMGCPSGSFADLTATPMQLTRARQQCQRDGVDMVSLTLMLDCEIGHAFGNGLPSAVVQPGQILVKDLAETAVADWQSGDHRGLSLHLPRMTVNAAIGDRIGCLHGRVLSGNGLGALLKAQMMTLAEIAPGLDPEARAAGLEVMVSLATTVLRLELGAPPRQDENHAGMFAAAKAFIDRHLASPGLSPEMIAHRLHCSRAHLYRVFAAHDQTVAGYVREARLRRARDLLGATGQSARVGDVAFACGFDDPVHFARLFRRHFGLTPSEARASSQG